MHEDAPKMSVTHSLAASTSQPKSDIVTEVANEYAMSSTDEKQPESINLDLKIAYVDPTSGKCYRTLHFLIQTFMTNYLPTYVYFCE